jgi:predicted alpha/beta superfamily hydrolase
VVLPEKYKAGSNDKYDVLYVLDGEGNTRTAADVQYFIENEGYMPPVIIVGIINVDRNRDFTPTHVADNTTSGGAAPFLGFLKNELIPYINKTYPSTGNNIIFGHSLGGLFVTYALFNEPQAFNSYLGADPSYWWDKNYLNKVAVEKLPGLANLNKTLYISGRQGQPYQGMGIVGMDSILKAKGPAGFFWKDLAYPDETHGSVRLKSMYDGLKFIYSGYSLKAPEFHPMNGIVLKDKPIKIWYFDDPSKVHYTTDGTKPTLASAKLQPEITLAGSATVTATLFANGDAYDKTTTGEFKEGTYLPTVPKARNFTPGGFHYDYYEGAWDKLPDFKQLRPVKSGRIDSTFNFSKLPRKTNFGLVFEGQLKVKEEGYYIFALDSDDGSKFYLGNQLIIDYDGLHGTGDIKSYILPLTKGFYPVRIEYFQKDGGSDLKLQYLTPSIIKIPPQPISIPFALQYSNK